MRAKARPPETDQWWGYERPRWWHDFKATADWRVTCTVGLFKLRYDYSDYTEEERLFLIGQRAPLAAS